MKYLVEGRIIDKIIKTFLLIEASYNITHDPRQAMECRLQELNDILKYCEAKE
jgi:hypothetical protein